MTETCQISLNLLRSYPLRASVLTSLIIMLLGVICPAREPDRLIDVWPDRAPGETTKLAGETLPRRPDENPPATRVKNITQPRLAVYQPRRANGTAIIVFPGGGYNYVVTDKEGSEAADWLNEYGVTVCVLHYRTKDKSGEPPWRRPLQDGQRAIRLLRSQADELSLQPDRIGILGFSAGGQAASLVATRFDQPAYPPNDKTDQVSCRADFTLLIYPWHLVDPNGTLMTEITIGAETPPTFLVHAHNDGATSLSSIEFYRALKQHQVSAELHIFQAGGHGYGMRPVAGTNIHTWPARATEWLTQRELIRK